MTEIFRTYDIRGIYPTELNEETAFRVGKTTAKFLNAKILVVGEDARVSSPVLRAKLVEGITSMGCDVLYIGQSTTPLFYFSVNKLKADGGVMVTASHNPKEYNGLKIVGPGSVPVSFDAGLKEIKTLAEENKFESGTAGTVKNTNLVQDYASFVIEKSQILNAKTEKLKVVIDAGNGMTSLVLKPLLEKINLNNVSLFFNIDCTFPNRSPDVSIAENLRALSNMVITEKADLGVAFDADGDRVIFTDEKGGFIPSSFMVALLFEDAKTFFHKPKVVYDMRFSRSVKELLGSNGFKSRPGHSFIKQAMMVNDADFGGELSGHLFFKEMNYVESSILGMLKIIRILSSNGKPMSELIKPFQKYYNSGEINMTIKGREDGIKDERNNRNHLVSGSSFK